MDFIYFMVIIAYILVPSLKVSIALDSIHLSQSITDGNSNNNTLVSQGGTFELGFFNTDGNSNKRYLGIWYKNIPIHTVVWVANGANPINGSSGTLTLNTSGNLVLTQNGSQNPVAELLDNGNLVVRDGNQANPEAYLWQSFDYPSNTFLPEMKVGLDLQNGLEWRLTSWKNPEDPSPGDFYWGLVVRSYPEFYMMNATEKFFRVGPFNGLRFSGLPEQKQPNSIYEFRYVTNKDEMAYSYSLKNSSVFSIVVINQTSYKFSRYVWLKDEQNWKLFSSLPRDYCDTYSLCGANGNCIITELQACQCLQGFSPKSPQAWNSSDFSRGCVRNKPLSCKDKLKDGFVKMEGLKVPETTHAWLNETIGLDECRAKCLNDCSCMAYANSDITGAGSGCVMWFGDLIDIRHFEAGGQDLYIRMDASELEPKYQHRRKKNATTIVASTIAAICGMLLLGIYFIYGNRKNIAGNSETEDDNERHEDDLDLPLFDLPTITTATNGFSLENKIGEGGFGPVYRGKLADGQEIAVKRLSRSSGQGMTEFINEVKLIAKLQHRNLVKLLGCCIQGQEKMLVYEYMANSSLDSFIFDHTKGKLLEWPQRFHIICGIARGLMYLHQDSRLRIIHRDLKASNVLLDDNLNPKISDFGMAKTFGGDQTEGNTNRVVGTFGYMAPEYAIDGLFSVKSDVFSFGILLLEIVCGKRNRGLYQTDDTLNLVGHAWTKWKEGKALELIDSNMEDTYVQSEVLRCIHVGLLCVQQYPEDRPTMASVILMLGSEMELVEPKAHGFISRKVSMDAYLRSNQKDASSSTNELTITSLHPR